MKNTFFLVDAFTKDKFKGNPAGVCILEEDLADDLMKQIACEVGASETAFLDLRSNSLRWFTPKVEVALCGHATLATVVAIHDMGLLHEDETARLMTKSGPLQVKINAGRVTMTFPLGGLPVSVDQDQPILKSLGLNSEILFYGKSGVKTLIEVPSEETVRTLSPDYEELLKLDAYGVIVTCMGSHGYDFVSRFFHPWAGVNEDPVTGSAHCILAAYYKNKLQKDAMVGFQASSRGGEVAVEVLDHARVNLMGHGEIVFRGTLSV